MRIGIFARTFARASVEETFAAVAESGIEGAQFNFSVAGLPTLPERIEPALLGQIGVAARAVGISIPSISGTFNMIDPVEERRAEAIRRFGLLAAAAADLGIEVVTLCTGTRDPDDMWRAHPGNETAAAWDDLRRSMEALLAVAERRGVVLGMEPEVANVVGTAAAARRLLDEMGNPRLRIIFDGANLMRPGERRRQREILEEAVGLLGDEVMMAHAKDVRFVEPLEYVAAGRGELDFPFYLGALERAGFGGWLMLHGLGEPEVPGAVACLEALVKARGKKVKEQR